jgi:Family of unknown function (DUF6206)
VNGRTTLSDVRLRELDDLVERALADRDEDRLPVLGFGEISLVLAWPAQGPRFACKRLPVFPTRERFAAYRATLEDYVDALRDAGVDVIQTEMRGVPRPDGTVVGYVVQPMLPAEALAPEILRDTGAGSGHPLVTEVVATAARAVSPQVGLDAQLANWMIDGEALRYIDVSTPMIWGDNGRSRLDIEHLGRAYPAVLRTPLRRFLAPRILDGYRDLRKVYLDLTGNLLKERLERWLPAFLEQLNRYLDQPLSEREVRRYYRTDARLWAALLRVRRLDRAWHRQLRRPYPFLLPGRIER